MPEIFLESEIDYKGNDFELIPFGAGRRMCPGLPLAYRSVHLIIASLIHKYKWKLADDLHPNEVDMEEKFGLTLKRFTLLGPFQPKFDPTIAYSNPVIELYYVQVSKSQVLLLSSMITSFQSKLSCIVVT